MNEVHVVIEPNWPVLFGVICLVGAAWFVAALVMFPTFRKAVLWGALAVFGVWYVANFPPPRTNRQVAETQAYARAATSCAVLATGRFEKCAP